MPEKELNKKVCIILPVYNVKPYIERCIRSITDQTWRNYDVLLVDDGSTDGSGQICDGLAARNDNIICYHKTNGGAGDARNFGIEQSRGGGTAILLLLTLMIFWKHVI